MLYNIKTTEFSGAVEAETIVEALKNVTGQFIYAVRQPDECDADKLRNLLLDSGGIIVHPNDLNSVNCVI